MATPGKGGLYGRMAAAVSHHPAGGADPHAHRATAGAVPSHSPSTHGGSSSRVASSAASTGAGLAAPRSHSSAAAPAAAAASSTSDGTRDKVRDLSDEVRDLRDENERLRSTLMSLERLAPLLERLVERGDVSLADLASSGPRTVAAPSIRSPERPLGATGGPAEPSDRHAAAGAHGGFSGYSTTSYGGEVDPAAAAPAPERTVSELRIWTGTWNMGAKDPFERKDIAKNMDLVERILGPFVPLDYDLYVLGVQEAVSDSVYHALSAYTGCYQLPLHAKLDPAKEGKETSTIRSRRMGRAVCVQEFLLDAASGRHPEPVLTMTDMLDRVWGRGDGALLRPKFTGIAVFCNPAAAPYVRLLGVYKHSFGASEGSKGGVGVALGVYDSIIAFINAHMASKRMDARSQQYSDLVDRLGVKLGGRGFQLTEEFHHVVWMGDLNFHCADVSGDEAVAMLRQGRVADLLVKHDELIRERAAGRVFFNFEEPNMVPDFYPTYKKIPQRGFVDTERDEDWPSRVYNISYREPFYKGGRVMERVPSWTDRIMFRSLPSRADHLLPESLEPGNPEAPHNYRAVNNGCDISDHSPVFCTWRLRIALDPIDETLPEGVDPEDPELPLCVIGRGTLGVDPRDLPPALRPLSVVLTVTNIRVNYRKMMRSPRAMSMLFPLPFEDGDSLPERAKIVRTGTIMSMAQRSDTREGLTGGISVLISRANKLPELHLLIKVSLEDGTKAQAVVSMAECGVTDVGRVAVTRFVPLMRNGLRAVIGGSGGGPIDLEFTLEYHGHYASDDQVVAARMMRDAAGAPPTPVPRSRAAERLRAIGTTMMAPSPGGADFSHLRAGVTSTGSSALPPAPAASRDYERGFDDDEDEDYDDDDGMDDGMGGGGGYAGPGGAVTVEDLEHDPYASAPTGYGSMMSRSRGSAPTSSTRSPASAAATATSTSGSGRVVAPARAAPVGNARLLASPVRSGGFASPSATAVTPSAGMAGPAPSRSTTGLAGATSFGQPRERATGVAAASASTVLTAGRSRPVAGMPTARGPAPGGADDDDDDDDEIEVDDDGDDDEDDEGAGRMHR